MQVHLDELDEFDLPVSAGPNVSLIRVRDANVIGRLRIHRMVPRFDADEDRAVIVASDSVLEHIVSRVTERSLDDVILDLVTVGEGLNVDPLLQAGQIVRVDKEVSNILTSHVAVDAVSLHEV